MCVGLVAPRGDKNNATDVRFARVFLLCKSPLSHRLPAFAPLLASVLPPQLHLLTVLK